MNFDKFGFIGYFYYFYREICDGRELKVFVKDVFLLLA